MPTAAAAVLTVLAGAVGLAWLSRHLLISREKRSGVSLTEDYPGPQGAPPRISVVVAARNEEANIENCVRSMLDQDYGDYELIVCNDRSTDGTADIVRRIARENRQVRLIDIDRLPEGWCGKNNAMRNGIAASTGQWICMIDADCVQTSRRTLSAAMSYALDTEADLLSVLPVLRMDSFWENVVQPVCGGVMMIWFTPDKVNDPRRSNAYANGAFMLIRKEAYDKIGGHQAVRDQVNEDMHIAALVKRAGLNLRVVRNAGLYTVRMYASLREILRGWSRIFYGTFGTLRRLTVSLAVITAMGPLPYITAAAGLSLGLAGVAPAGWWLACGSVSAAAVVLQISVIARFYRLVGARPWLAWSYVLGCVVTIAALVVSLTKLRRGAKLTWRGTSYSAPRV